MNILHPRYRRTELNNRAERIVAQATRQAVDQTATTNMPGTVEAAGVPVQIIIGGHPIVSMQRWQWRPDRITAEAA